MSCVIASLDAIDDSHLTDRQRGREQPLLFMNGTSRTLATSLALAAAACGSAKTARTMREAAPPSAAAVAAPPEPQPLASQRVEPAASAPCGPAHTERPCFFLLQGRCYLDRAPATDYVPIACPQSFPLQGDACRKLEMCVGVSDEGCCVGCQSMMATRIANSCAAAIEQARTCAEVVRAQEQRGCVR